MNNNSNDKIEKILDIVIIGINEGRYDYAEKYLKDGLKEFPEDHQLIESLALLMNLSGNIDEAVEAYKKAVKLNPENVKNYYFLGRLYNDTGRHVESMAILSNGIYQCQQKLKTNKMDLEAIKDLARINSYRSEHEKSMLTIFRGLEIAGTDIELLRMLVQEEYLLEQYLQVLKEGNEILKTVEKDPVIFLYMGLACHKLNLISKALEYFKLSFKLDDSQEEIKGLIGKLSDIIKNNNSTIEELIYTSKTEEFFTGTVKWFKDESGIGYLQTADGKDVFVHYLAIKKEGYQSLKEGQKVKFGIIDSPQGLLATNIEEISNIDKYKGVITNFNKETGIGEIEIDTGKNIFIHFTSIMGTGVRLPVNGVMVEFEIFNTDSGPQAFNVKIITSDETQIKKKTNKSRGKIVWYDPEKGVGLISYGNIKAIFHKEDIIKGIPLEGKMADFITVVMEALKDENVKKAKEIEIEA